MLEGVRVVDLTRILAGPWATQMLADFGADVVKIERPGRGDDTRQWGPPWFGEGAARRSAYFMSANRGKRSITLDIATRRGQAIVRKLVANADVLVENFRVGQLARYGLAFSDLQSVNPRLVYCSITGFGQTGPDSARAGYDAMIQAMGGIMSVTGEADGPPQKVGVAVADLMCGMYAVNGILAALVAARESGVGTHIDLSLFDSQLGWLANQGMNYMVSGHAPGRHGSAHPNIVPYQPFECCDGFVMLAIGNDEQFRRWCKLAELAELATDRRTANNAARVAHRDWLVKTMADRMRTESTSFWLKTCRDQGIPCGPINTISEAFNEPQAKYREMQIELSSPVGPIPQIANPLRFNDVSSTSELPPPLLGQHTAELLGELGFSDEEIRQLEDADIT